MTDYIVIKISNFDKFVQTINQKIKEGYICQGGVSETPYGGHYLQAMIKNKNI